MDASASVFQLYQPGLAPDHVLQLCYLRQRAPRLEQTNRTRIETEFVLPRPELKIADILPAVDVPLQQLVASSTHTTDSSAAAEPLAETALIHAKETAMRHFLQPRLAATEDVRQWSALTESDWLQIHRKQQGEDDDMTGLAPLPGIADVCWLLEQCPSDALADFVWGHLLLSLLQQSNNTNETSTQQQLLSLLASHHSFASLSPKDFRAKVRSRNLRQVDDVGAQAELALVALYREQRDCAK